MKDRIKRIMESENQTAAKFADRLDVSRAVISHILNGRNNPSLDVVTKILGEMDYINPEWLLSGTGSIYKSGVDPNSIPREPDLFNQNEINPLPYPESPEKVKEMDVKVVDQYIQFAEKKQDSSISRPVRKIARIIVYYTDNTFESFSPEK